MRRQIDLRATVLAPAGHLAGLRCGRIAGVVINDWWSGDPAERFWMETTKRADLGVDLNAPRLNGAGKAQWDYTLVSETRPGDVVFHWHTALVGRPALVGWSIVTGPLSVDPDYSWMPQGTRGRARGVPTVGQGWRMPCGGFNHLDHPIDGRTLAEREGRLRAVQDELKAKTRGALYFPFSFYRPGEIRAFQSYLTKFPVALLDVLPELAEALPAADQSKHAEPPRRTHQHPARTARQNDVRLRQAVEQHAVRLARDHYLELGAIDVVELGKPYDLIVHGLGPVRHVEVKGSTMVLSAVELTVNEVAHASNHQPTDLFVVDRIEAVEQADGTYVTSGGLSRIWRDWAPAEMHLSPTRYAYALPSTTAK
jgi:hypothetical protein